MIQNLEITKKLSEKTESDPVTRDFLMTLLENASEGKSLKKITEREIEKITKNSMEG